MSLWHDNCTWLITITTINASNSYDNPTTTTKYLLTTGPRGLERLLRMSFLAPDSSALAETFSARSSPAFCATG